MTSQVLQTNDVKRVTRELNISPDEPALVVDHVFKRFNVATEPWWRRVLPARTAQNGAAAQTNGNETPSTNGAEKALKARRGKELVTAVNDVSFTVQRREIFGVLGPNGSGKSTLIRLLSTLLVPDEGEIKVFGLDVIKHEMQVKRLINRVSVEAAFFKKLSPQENLLYGARLYGLAGKEADRKARVILKRLGLKESSYSAPMEDMSRGMQQKVAIARAFLTQPILLLLDEPTTGLDPRSKLEVQAVVNELRDDHDATILITTHDMNEADALCDRIAIIDDGKIVALDTPENLKKSIRRNGHEPTLEEVFMQLTGKELVEKEDVEDYQPEKILAG
ncbi:MAG: ABC transporter ATP-binding protein [Chloroflexi bacterium]|nr:ABC transporter ATP-binding protein [Chloroflexota bacterium]